MSRKRTSDLWWKNAIVYCLDVETFLDSDGDGCGDLVGLTERLDYLAGLGVTCIWLMPFYPSAHGDDGYDVTYFYGIDGRLGTPGDFAELIRTASDRGIRVIADVVLNHTSSEHPWYRSARRGRDDPYHDFYVWADERPEQHADEVVFPDKEDSNWDYDRKARRWFLHRFYRHQPELNVANPEVRDELAQVLGYWLQQGLAGFRVDAVPFLLDPTGLPEGAHVDPHELMRDLRRYVCRHRGDAVLLGEVNLPPRDARRFFGGDEGDELHMCFGFALNQAMYLALARGDAGPVAATLRELPDIPEECQWANFVRNHDELTLDQLTDEERAEVFAAFGPEERHQLFGRGLRRRLPTMLDGDQERIRMVYSLVFSLPGTPVLFFGEEIGMAENLAIEGRMSVRAPMQWSRERHGGFTTGEEPVRPLVDEPGWGHGEVSVARQRREDGSLLNWMERLIRRRRECPEIGWGRATVLDVGTSAVLAHRCDWDGNVVVALHSFSAEPLEVEVPVGDEAEAAVDLFADRELEPEDGALALSLDPYGHVWLRLRHPGQRLPP
ncbi:MAG TPA: alpha-amylase family protein [Gaiellaceae bacterium]|nr:alpha-amylase family protein [Gaiellaceae bacterium]